MALKQESSIADDAMRIRLEYFAGSTSLSSALAARPSGESQETLSVRGSLDDERVVTGMNTFSSRVQVQYSSTT